MDNDTYSARMIGALHGVGAADGFIAWVWRTLDEGQQAEALRIIAEGDSDEDGLLPAPDLSGQWADGYTPQALLNDVGATDDGIDVLPDLCDAYEDAFLTASRSYLRERLIG